MVLIDFFCAEFKSDKCQLEKFGHFCKLKVKDQILRLIMIFQQMKLGEQVFKSHLPTQQDSTSLITLSGFRIRTLKR